MKAGTYYVGDLCYVLHDEWDEVCELIIKDNVCLDGEFTLRDGRRFAIYGTAYGDGNYFDQNGKSYDVDAGSIGCILMNDIIKAILLPSRIISMETDQLVLEDIYSLWKQFTFFDDDDIVAGGLYKHRNIDIEL
jgi:hypothetical protein